MEQEEKDYLIEQANDPNVENIGQVSDGYHTFDSLYNQRLYLWAALVKVYKDKAWKTRRHNNGELCFGDGDWFLVGISTPQGDYSYHYEIKYWDLFDCKEIETAPPFDGHTDKDVSRVMSLGRELVEIQVEHEPTFDFNTNPALKRGGVLNGLKHVEVSPDYEDDYDRARKNIINRDNY